MSSTTQNSQSGTHAKEKYPRKDSKRTKSSQLAFKSEEMLSETDFSRLLGTVKVETAAVPTTRQQELLDEIDREKIKYVVDVGDLLKYYQKKPNIRKYRNENPQPEGIPDQVTAAVAAPKPLLLSDFVSDEFLESKEF